MDGAHDLGGMHGHGPIPRELDEAFRADWQRRVFALTEALAPVAGFGPDHHRAAIERIPPERYLRHDYFARWLEATETLLLDAGLIGAEELRTGTVDSSRSNPGVRAIGAEALVAAARAGAAPSSGDADPAARFRVGEAVRASVDAPPWHTRVPRYVRGRVGTVARDAGVAAFAESVARGAGPDPQHVYSVAFTARSLWGRHAEVPDDLVHVDLWETSLEPA